VTWQLVRICMTCWLFAVGGCAVNEPRVSSSVWVKPGATAADFRIDHGQCTAQAFSIPNAPLIQVAIVQSQCMRGKGWVIEERSPGR
jgi:hypothetical protein